MPLYLNKTEFFDRGILRLFPNEDWANEDCKICLHPLDLFEQPDTTDPDPRLHSAVRIRCCNHVLGAECLDAWLGDNNTCPVCNRMLFMPTGKQLASPYEINAIRRDLEDKVHEDTADQVIANYIHMVEDQVAMRKRENEIQINIERTKLEDDARRDHEDNLLMAEDFEDSDAEDVMDWDLDVEEDDEQDAEDDEYEIDDHED